MSISKADRLALSDEETFQDPAVAHDIFTRMRAEEPVAFCPEPWGGKGFWSITKYDDIEAISKLPNIFSSDGKHGGITLPTPEMIANRRDLTLEAVQGPAELADFEGGRSMISMDPPEHNKHRRMVAPGFTPQRLDALISRIRTRADALLDQVGAKGNAESDFVADIAAELPIQMLAELFAVAQSDRHKLFEWSNIMIGGDDPEINVSREKTMGAFMELAAYAMQLYEARKVEPRDDLITMLVNTEVDEIIRWVHPVIYMRRTALEDYVLRDVTIKAGDKVALWYMSGNRDEDKWDDPFEFDISRQGPRHLSFGYGQHLCIGWRLAEIQLRILLEGVLARYPALEVTGPVTRMRTNFLNSIKTMPVRYAA